MIPDLAFHNQTAHRLTDAKLVEDRLASLMPRAKDFSVLGSPSAFVSMKADVNINGMTLVALSPSPYHLDRVACRFPEIWIPLHGQINAFDGESRHSSGGDKAYFCTSYQIPLISTHAPIHAVRWT